MEFLLKESLLEEVDPQTEFQGINELEFLITENDVGNSNNENNVEVEGWIPVRENNLLTNASPLYDGYTTQSDTTFLSYSQTDEGIQSSNTEESRHLVNSMDKSSTYFMQATGIIESGQILQLLPGKQSLGLSGRPRCTDTIDGSLIGKVPNHHLLNPNIPMNTELYTTNDQHFRHFSPDLNVDTKLDDLRTSREESCRLDVQYTDQFAISTDNADTALSRLLSCELEIQPEKEQILNCDGCDDSVEDLKDNSVWLSDEQQTIPCLDILLPSNQTVSMETKELLDRPEETTRIGVDSNLFTQGRKGRRYRLSELSYEDQCRVQKRREQNKRAAATYREKQKHLEHNLLQEEKVLINENGMINSDIESLQVQVAELEKILSSHLTSCLNNDKLSF